MLKIETFVPVFTGYYGNMYWETDNDEYLEAEYLAEGLVDNYEMFENFDVDLILEHLCEVIDYEEYHNDLGDEITHVICGELEREGYISDFEYQDVESPQFYNFRNDSLNVLLHINKENHKEIVNILIREKEWFSEYVKENYTSRSGFISYHSNEVDEWFDYIIDYDNLDDDLHKLGAILDFICQHVLEMDESWVHENVTYVHIGGYYDIDKLIKKLNSTL